MRWRSISRSRTSDDTSIGQRAQEDAGAAHLDEEDERRIVGAQEEPQLVAQLAGAPADGAQVLARVLHARDRLVERVEGAEQRQARLADARRALRA